jgi:hypothetical protein
MKKIYSKPAMDIVQMSGFDIVTNSPLGDDQIGMGDGQVTGGYGEAPNRRNAIWDE